MRVCSPNVDTILKIDVARSSIDVQPQDRKQPDFLHLVFLALDDYRKETGDLPAPHDAAVDKVVQLTAAKQRRPMSTLTRCGGSVDMADFSG